MRWYCVHPGLPLQAELRVRAAPDSGTAERARVSQGSAIAACSPVFQVAGDAADDAPISWLQVAYQDAASGETEGGFMMASLPDGTPLLAPWETTDFCGCCEVTDPAALLFDESKETAQSLGPVQSVNLLYCMMEVRGGRVRIFHPTLQSAWIDAKDVHVVCSRLKHDFCSTAHTFYELNETLPEEAQIAIREFPSKEAQTVGLLSRGETLEVTVRSGNWLKIAGGSVDKAWIMWRTDALELLQEAPDVCSGNCERLDMKADNSGGLQDQGATIDNQTEPPCPHEVAEESATGMVPTPNAEIDAAPEVDAAASAAASVAMDDEASAVAGDLPATNDAIDTAENAEINDPCQDNDGALPNGTKSKENASRDGGSIKADGSLDDRPIRSASTAFIATEDAEVAQVGPSWEDRPIRPAPSLPAVAGHDDSTTAEVKTEHVDCGGQDGKAMEPVRKDNLAAFDGNLVEPRAGRIQQNNHYLHPTNPTNAFERRYTESETTSGSESGEIAFLGGLEDVFDPVDELLPAMAEDIIREIDEGITGVLSAAASEPVSIGAASVDGNLHDANQAALDKTPFDNGSPSDGISYLQHFGIGKYCEHKQSLAAGSDELSQAMYEANQDDSDLVFQALVGDEPLSDDWFHEVSLRDLQAGPHLRAGPKTTYDLIMANASPDDILEAELLDDEDGDFDLIMSFKYPVPKRRAIEPRRSPSLFRRVPSAPTGMSAIETKTAISPAKPSSESDLDSDDSPSGSRQPSPASHRASISARTSPIPAKSTTPLKSVLPRQPVGPPSSPVPPAGSRLMQRKSIATPSSIRKPPSSLLRPRSFVQSSQPAAPASPALSKPAASGLTAPSRSSIPATSTSSIATPTRSLLQRRSMLSAPSPAKTIAAPSATRSSITGSIPKPTEVSSGLQAPRKSFGFGRPSGLTKKT